MFREECDEFELSAPRYALKLGDICAADGCLELIASKIGAIRTKDTLFAPELALEMPELVTSPSPRIPSTSRRLSTQSSNAHVSTAGSRHFRQLSSIYKLKWATHTHMVVSSSEKVINLS